MHVPRFCLRIFQSNEGRAVTRKTAGMAGNVGAAESSIQMHRSHPLPNTFTAILNTPWMCAHPDFKPESRVRGLVCPDLGLQTQSPVKTTTSNLSRRFVVVTCPRTKSGPTHNMWVLTGNEMPGA